MAIYHPSTAPADIPNSERKVWQSLEPLDNDWHVLHSVAWIGPRERGRPSDGEIDFVLLHPEVGVLLLEVKGGRIELTDGQWTTIDRNGVSHTIDPFKQVKESKHSLRTYLKEARPPVSWVEDCHAVAFPDCTVASQSLGPNAPREVILDRDDLKDAPRAITRVARYWNQRGMSAQDVRRILDLLAPTGTIRPLLRDEVEEVKQELIELTDQQVELLGFLRSHRRVLVRGGAGTGKTLMAVEKARHFDTEGRRTLLLCYNAPLGDHLATQFADAASVTSTSYHQFVLSQVREAGLRRPPDPDDRFWNHEAPNLLTSAVKHTGFSANALIIDEAQDFRPKWFDSVLYLLDDPDNDPVYLFADTHQDLYVDGWSPPFDDPPFPLDVNCRNTKQISRLVAKAIGDEAVRTRGVVGPEPETHPAEDQKAALEALRKVLHRLLREEQVPSGKITVLCDRKELLDELRCREFAGEHLVPLGEPGVHAETIHRFKGLESDVVILLLSRLETRKDRQLAYVGLSRACTYLVLICPSTVAEELGLQ